MKQCLKCYVCISEIHHAIGDMLPFRLLCAISETLDVLAPPLYLFIYSFKGIESLSI